MRPTRTRNPNRIVLSAVLALVAGLWLGVPTVRAQSYAGPFRGNYAGYYYSNGGYSGGYYFHPGYYPNPAAPVVAPARPSYSNYNYSRPNYYSTAASNSSNYSIEDWSTGRTNYPIPLTKPWMMPLRK